MCTRVTVLCLSVCYRSPRFCFYVNIKLYLPAYSLLVFLRFQLSDFDKTVSFGRYCACHGFLLVTREVLYIKHAHAISINCESGCCNSSPSDWHSYRQNTNRWLCCTCRLRYNLQRNQEYIREREGECRTRVYCCGLMIFMRLRTKC